MAPFWLLVLLLKCIDFLSWPVLALGFPLCASVQAIENDNSSDTRNLISYWILLSLIYLFEYAFLKLLQWFQYWYYMKLMIVVCLVIPDFGRAYHVYNQLFRSCFYMNPYVVISKFRNWKRIFVKNEDFLMLAEKYITENGSGALEKLIASMSTGQSPHAETRKEILTTTEKNEILKANNMALDSLKSNESTSEKMPADPAHVTYPQIYASENVQTEWACAICQLTWPSEAHLNSHMQGRKHKAACEAQNKKTKAMSVKDTGNRTSPWVSASKNVQRM